MEVKHIISNYSLKLLNCEYQATELTAQGVSWQYSASWHAIQKAVCRCIQKSNAQALPRRHISSPLAFHPSGCWKGKCLVSHLAFQVLLLDPDIPGLHLTLPRSDHSGLDLPQEIWSVPVRFGLKFFLEISHQFEHLGLKTKCEMRREYKLV